MLGYLFKELAVPCGTDVTGAVAGLHIKRLAEVRQNDRAATLHLLLTVGNLHAMHFISPTIS